MNTRKLRKVLLTLCSALLLVSLSVGMTIAYLTDTESVKNTFTVGKVVIDLDEAPVGDNGRKIEGDRVKENAYHLMPGHTYDKDPTVWIGEGSEESFVRMIVKITNLSGLRQAFGADFLPQNHVQGWDSSIWVPQAMEVEGDTAICEFRYYKTVSFADNENDDKNEWDDLEPLFTQIVIDGDVDSDAFEALVDGLTITITADAIQAAGFEDNAEKAWTAFDAQKAAANQ